ncbi:MAG: dipeptide epimerase [Myxococcota bacterium]
MRHSVRTETWPIEGGFRIARGARDAAEVVVVEFEDDGAIGRGEAVPYARYGETVASVVRSVERTLAALDGGLTREALGEALSPGAARNALDLALWELEAKKAGAPVWKLLGLPEVPVEVETMRTVSVDSPEVMADAAHGLPATVLKVKVDGDESDLERIEAVHQAAPGAMLVVDPNESWSSPQLERRLPELTALGVAALEQPLPAGADDALRSLRGDVLFCADESFHDRESFDLVSERYDVVNIKLDKAGGMTEAAKVCREAASRGLHVIVGCMVSTSLAILPALPLAATAKFVDLDGPFLLARDREGAAHDASRSVLRPSPAIWGP